ncbi:hypothetical protein C0J52_03737 [Blattella germanica]|nr:hypothetical protein C0J52_03737 [Blattella germanica]
MQQKPRILLLYALDCKPFMTLMATFREVLKDATKCEVYDCFDPKLSEEIARNKTDWLRHRIATSKVIVVESKCAVLHQNALLKQGKVMYKEPVSNCLDDLFVYGLKALTDNCFGTYEKIFVVRINGFSELKDELKHITPYSRYTIPQHMEKLLTSLYQINYPGYELCNTDENVDIRMLKLYECILNLENYKTGTPDYLDMLFVKESDQEV